MNLSSWPELEVTASMLGKIGITPKNFVHSFLSLLISEIEAMVTPV